jgi:hypothetical protein
MHLCQVLADVLCAQLSCMTALYVIPQRRDNLSMRCGCSVSGSGTGGRVMPEVAGHAFAVSELGAYLVLYRGYWVVRLEARE